MSFYFNLKEDLKNLNEYSIFFNNEGTTINSIANNRNESEEEVIEGIIELVKDINRNCIQLGEKKFIPISLPDLKLLNRLISILIIEIVYPNLEPGVGILLAKRTTLYDSTAIKKLNNTESFNNNQLSNINSNNFKYVINSFIEIIKDNGDVGNLLIKGHFASDIVSSLAQLMHFSEETDNNFYLLQFKNTISLLDTYSLISIFTTLLTKDAPQWFKKILASTLSNIPLERSDGVKSIIEFISRSREEEQIDVKNLQRAAVVVSNPPSNMSADAYFKKISCQFLTLLSPKNSSVILKSVTSQIINILFKSPKKKFIIIYIINPLKENINPCLKKNFIIKSEHENENLNTSSENLSESLSSITILMKYADSDLILFTLNDLIKPIFIIYLYAKKTHRVLPDCEILITLYFKITKDPYKFIDLTSLSPDSSISDNNNNSFICAPDINGVKIISGNNTNSSIDLNPLKDPEQSLLSLLQDKFTALQLLSLMENFNDEFVNSIFLAIFEKWLNLRKLSSNEPIIILKNLHFLESCVEKFKEKLIKSPSQLILMVSKVLQDYYEEFFDSDKDIKNEQEILSKKINKLSIVQEEDKNIDLDEDSDADSDDEIEEEESATVLSTALSIISVILSDYDSNYYHISENDKRVLSTWPNLLNQLIEKKSPSNIISSSKNLLKILNSLKIGSITDKNKSNSNMMYEAICNLKDPLIPIQAYGLKVIRKLIDEHDSSVKSKKLIPLLINKVSDSDSFIYLNSIKCLESLSYHYTEETIPDLLKLYQNQKEILDLRLRIGECLQRTIENLNTTFQGDLASSVCCVLLDIISVNKGKTKDDNKIRMSALSILGTACQVNLVGIYKIIPNAIDCVLGILTFETSENEDDVLVRRSSIVLLGSLFKGISNLQDYPSQYVKDTLRILRYIKEVDSDQLCRIQAGNVIDIIKDTISDQLVYEY